MRRLLRYAVEQGSAGFLRVIKHRRGVVVPFDVRLCIDFNAIQIDLRQLCLSKRHARYVLNRIVLVLYSDIHLKPNIPLAAPHQPKVAYVVPKWVYNAVVVLVYTELKLEAGIERVRHRYICGGDDPEFMTAPVRQDERRRNNIVCVVKFNSDRQSRHLRSLFWRVLNNRRVLQHHAARERDSYFIAPAANRVPNARKLKVKIIM